MIQTQHIIINGDCRKMAELEDNSVHLIITSPPYWQLKDYGSDQQIDFDFMGQIIWQKTTTTNTTGGGAVMGSFPYPRNGIVKLDFEYILLFKKQGEAPKPTKEQKEQSTMSNEDWNTYFNGHWYFNGVSQLNFKRNVGATSESI